MHQNRHEPKRNLWRKPSIRLVRAPLKLVDDVCYFEMTTFQFNWHYPVFPVLLSDEYVIATFLVVWDRQCGTVEIDNDLPGCSCSNGNRTTILVTIMGLTAIGNCAGGDFNYTVHIYLLSCMRL